MEPKEPTYGWCCKCFDNAQSAHVDSKGNRYCKSCFKEFCPRLHAKLLNQRRHSHSECGYCGEIKELQQGFCRPCRRARECQTCRAVNEGFEATVCVSCCKRRKALGASAQKLAAWCLTCTTLEERQSEFCLDCYKDVQSRPCHHCAAETKLDAVRHK